MKQCKVCGKMSNDAERFCFICGNRFEEKQDSGQTSENTGRTKEEMFNHWLRERLKTENVLSRQLLSYLDEIYENWSDITSIEIPNNIYTIRDSAICGFPNLRSIIIPDSVVSIERYAFSGCGIENIEIPNSVKWIEDYAFNECTKLRSVVLPENIESIGEYVFKGCSSLTDFHFPYNITSIPKGLFWGCTA